jgi:hypothetical protein
MMVRDGVLLARERRLECTWVRVHMPDIGGCPLASLIIRAKLLIVTALTTTGSSIMSQRLVVAYVRKRPTFVWTIKRRISEGLSPSQRGKVRMRRSETLSTGFLRLPDHRKT